MSRDIPPDACVVDDGVRIRIGRGLYVSFERTRRVGAHDPLALPHSHGASPIAASDGTAAADFIVPVRDDEAIWLGLSAVREEIPCAVRVVVREPVEADAVTGSAPSTEFIHDPQNYVVVPPQHAVTGVTAEEGAARQFVRVSRGGHDAPCTHIHVVVRAATRHVVTAASSNSPLLHEGRGADRHTRSRPAGHVIQRIIPDPYGPDTWRHAISTSVSIRLVAPETYVRATGRAAPGPLTDDTSYGGWRLP